MASRVQSAVGEASPCVATFGDTPTEGNLLVATVYERSGNAHSGFSISGSGWTKRIGRDAEISDSTYRRSMAVWTKVAGSSEPTGITMTTGATAKGIIQEFEHDGDEDLWEFLDESSADNGTTSNASSLSSGSTASVSGASFLELGFYYVKRGASDPLIFSSAFTNGLGDEVESSSGINGRIVAVAYDGDDTTEETKSTTVSHTATGGIVNNGLISAIAVFRTEAAGGGRIMSSLAGPGGLASRGGIAGDGGGLAG